MQASSQEDKYQKEIEASKVEMYDEARQLRKNGQYDEAITKFKELIEIEPEYYLAHYNLALAYLSKKETELAIEYFNSAVEIREKNNLPETSIYNTLGYVYYKNGDYANAERFYKEGLKEENYALLSESSKRKINNNIGVLYMHDGQYDKSEKYLQVSANTFDSRQAEYNLERLNQYQNAKQEKMKEDDNYYFVIVGSFEELEKANEFANELSDLNEQYKIEIYKSENEFYAVTLGGYLNYNEALDRVSHAKSSKMLHDAYVKKSKNWGENLY